MAYDHGDGLDRRQPVKYMRWVRPPECGQSRQRAREVAPTGRMKNSLMRFSEGERNTPQPWPSQLQFRRRLQRPVRTGRM
jgi:hypothetical protein